MIKRSYKAFTAMSIVAGSFLLLSCEADPDGLGSQFFEGDTAEGTKAAFDIVAYNISNLDSIRADGRLTDASRRDTIVLGAFNEPQFGKQKSSFVTQIRMQDYAPDFGVNPKIDSVVMTLKPRYYAKTDSIVTTTDDNFVWPVENVAAKKVVKTYPIYKYGKAKIGGKTSFTINVNEVNDFLGSVTDTVYSNKNVAVGTLVGSKTFNGNINSVTITKDADNTEILNKPAGLRINLDKNFFKTKIVDKVNQSEISNLSNFIRYFKGLRISVAEDDGYMMKLAVPTSSDITMYYSNDAGKDNKFTFDMSSTNASYSQIEFDRTGSAISGVLAGSNATTGDSKLYVQGMGGPNFGVKLPEQSISQLKTLYNDDKIGIISAKLRFYTDASTWSNNYEKPTFFTVMQYKGKNVYEFLKDMSALSLSANYNLVRGVDLTKNPAYYDVNITQTVKDIVEKEEQNLPLILKMGKYLSSASSNALLGQNNDDRVYTPNRVVLVGTEAGNEKRAQLVVTYSKKK